MILAIDFDDVLCSRNPEPGYRMGVPEPGAILSTKRLIEQGHTIIVFTARDVQNPAAKKAVVDWLEYFNISYNGVTNIKSPAFDFIIDNRAMYFDGWPQVMSRLTKSEQTTTV